MDPILIKMAVASWFIAICLDICEVRKAWTEDAEMGFWAIKVASYLVAFVSTLFLIATA